jgi:hypothetical protein
MSDIDELVKRLRLLVQGKDLLNRPADFGDYWQGCEDAADALERQQREIADWQKRTEDRAMKLDAALAQVSEKDAEIEELKRDMRLCRGYDIVAEFRMLSAEPDDMLDKLIAAKDEIARLREGLRKIAEYPGGNHGDLEWREHARALLGDKP